MWSWYKLIDEYQNSTNININNTVKKDKKSKFSDSVSDLDIKGESNSFIPITIEKTHESKISKIKIPKLNFEKINKYNEINNYKWKITIEEGIRNKDKFFL